jgi:LCP family protein required for cell wall assembly
MHEELDQDQDLDRTLISSLAPDAPEPRTPAPPTWKSAAPVTPAPSSAPQAYFPRTDLKPQASSTPPASRIAPPPMYRESAARARMRQRRVKGRSTASEWSLVIIAAAIFGVVVIASMSVFLMLRTSRAAPAILPTATSDLAMLPTPANFRVEGSALAAGQTFTLDDGRSIVLEPWDGDGRFTVLAMGLDRRPGEEGLAYRTDTMMVISIDPATARIGILSIPRDLFVEVPGYYELQRINSAMVLGEVRQSGMGPTLTMQTVQYNLGIRVHAYLAVDFNAVIELVDAIGGIDVTIDYTINDRRFPDLNYGYDPFYLPAGSHHLNGYDALRFARTRHGDSDIERAERQQQVIYAIRDRILNLEMLPQLIFQAPSLLNAWSDNVYTGLSLDQMIELALYVKDIPQENLISGVIDYTYLTSWRTPQGADVLIPNRARLGDLMVQVFGPNYSE